MDTELTLESKIEGILFAKGDPVTVAELAKWLGTSKDDVTNALANLETNLAGRGITLVRKNDELMLGTNPLLTNVIETLRREELSKELSRASVETLAIIMYKNGVTRSEIDYIRGVNSSFILRNLAIRGLVEKVPYPGDNRKFVYRPTFELLQNMGVNSIEKLPDYARFHETLSAAFKDMRKIAVEDGETLAD